MIEEVSTHSLRLIYEAAKMLFEPGTRISATLEELSSLLENNDAESAEQIFKLQKLLFIEREQQHQTDEIAIILYSLPKPIQVLVVSIIDQKQNLWNYNLSQEIWESTKSQFQSAERIENEASEIETLIDLDQHLAQLKKLPINLEFRDLEITVHDLASKLTSLRALLQQLESIQLNIVKSKSGFGKFKNSLRNLFVSSDATYENQKKNLLHQLEISINLLPPIYQGAIRSATESISIAEQTNT